MCWKPEMTYFSICIMQRTIPQVDKVYTLSYRILPKKSMQYIAFITKYQIQWESVSIKDFWIWVQSRDPLSVGIRDEIIIFSVFKSFCVKKRQLGEIESLNICVFRNFNVWWSEVWLRREHTNDFALLSLSD